MAWVSESSQWWRSMAVVVVWGLMVATFLTLVVVPSMYYLLERGKERMAGLGARLRAQGRDGRT
jgi:Cu/Ag efflux pump CusA